MKIRKWYFDCITDQGEVIIAYHATTRFAGFPVFWSAIHFNGEDCFSKHAFSRSRIETARQEIRLDMPRYKTKGEWSGQGPCPEIILADEADLHICWQVICPNAQVQLSIDDRSLSGRGYVECLDIEFRKPSLPFHELQWGRFIADEGEDYRIWIDWRNGRNRTWVIAEKSRIATHAIISECAVILDNEELQLQKVRTLVEANIGSYFPAFLSGIFGGQLVKGTERKFLSRGKLHRINGWAIHETVRW